MKALKLILNLTLITICLFPPAQALCQTVSWTSSHPDIVSVDENTGAVEMISEPDSTTDVTITATTQQNGKTVTSIKTVQVDSCTACFTFNSLAYCGVKLSNGQCWLDRNIGAASTAEHGSMFYTAASAISACPTGWRRSTPAEFLEVVRLQTGNSSIAYTTNRNTITVAVMAAAPLKFVPPSDKCTCVRVQGGFFNWGAACAQGSIPLYRVDADENAWNMGVRCLKS